MKKTLIALLLLAPPVSASQNGFFESQRLESARQDKVNKPTPKPAVVDEPKNDGCPDQHVTATWSSAIPCKPRN